MRLIKLQLLLLFIASKAFGQGECPGQHCSAKAEVVNNMCKQLGQAGRPVFVEHQGTYCWCKCSCLASSTPVETDNNNWKAIGEVKVGETVLAINSNGNWEKSNVVYSDGSSMPEQPYPYAIYVTTENNITLITTASHLFLMSDGKLKRADKISPTDKLLDKSKKPLKITTITSGSYHGPIHHIATTNWDESKLTVDGHLINTSGVISADYFAELFLQPTQDLSPQVGSQEYLTKYRISEFVGNKSLKDTIQFSEKTRFIPHKQKKDPVNAMYFIPPGLDIAKAGELSPLDNSIPYEMALYLADHFRVYYPNVIYHIEWTDNRVNAFAWMEGNQRHVSLLGGLLRHSAIKIEGASLVLAHELGHHFGGNPKYPTNPWSSCEGQADYWGALVGMRKVWFGQTALENTDKGSVQLYNLFAYGLQRNLITMDWDKFKTENKLAGLCSHPPAACRLETYRAAMRADLKPACAGDQGK